MIEIDVPSKLLPKFDFLQDKISNDKVYFFFFLYEFFIEFYKFKLLLLLYSDYWNTKFQDDFQTFDTLLRRTENEFSIAQ